MSILGLVICSFFIYLTSLAFNLAYPVQLSNAFNFYSEGSFMGTLIYLQSLVGLVTLIINSVFLSEIFEDFSLIRKMLIVPGEKEELSRKGIFILRVIILLLSTSLAIWLSSAEKVVAFTGSFFSSMNGVIGPVSSLILSYSNF